MSDHPKINDRLAQIEFAGKANRYGETTITRMQDEYRRAMGGKSRVMAIKTFCAECMGWEKPLSKAIRACTDQGCSLHPYRPYQKFDADESDTKECTSSGASTP